MKSIALDRRFSGYSFFAVEKRVTGLKVDATRDSSQKLASGRRAGGL
jgi:hypothetical protein